MFKCSYFALLVAALFIIDVSSATEETRRCRLPLIDGPCRAMIPRWWYNSSANACTDFIYGGCGGNKNNFESKDKCEKRCRKPRTRKPKALKNP